MGKKSQVKDTSSNKSSEPPYRPEGYRDFMAKWSRAFIDDWINGQKDQEAQWARLEAAELERKEQYKEAEKTAPQRLAWLESTPPEAPTAPSAAPEALSTPPSDESLQAKARRLADEAADLHRQLEAKCDERNTAVRELHRQTRRSYSRLAVELDLSHSSVYRIVQGFRVGIENFSRKI